MTEVKRFRNYSEHQLFVGTLYARRRMDNFLKKSRLLYARYQVLKSEIIDDKITFRPIAYINIALEPKVCM